MTGTIRRRKTREESRAETRAHLLDAAKTLFARQGFEGTAIDEIAELAGYTRGAFYSNFEDKQTLLIALIERCFDDDLRGVAALQGDLADVTAGFGAAANLEEARHREAHLLKMEFWMCALRSPAVREAYERHHARLRAGIGQLIAAQFAALGRELPAPPEQLAAVAVTLRNGLDTQKLIGGPTSNETVPNELYGLTLHLLMTGDPPPR